jgi:hypothetical protein
MLLRSYLHALLACQLLLSAAQAVFPIQILITNPETGEMTLKSYNNEDELRTALYANPWLVEQLKKTTTLAQYKEQLPAFKTSTTPLKNGGAFVVPTTAFMDHLPGIYQKATHRTLPVKEAMGIKSVVEMRTENATVAATNQEVDRWRSTAIAHLVTVKKKTGKSHPELQRQILSGLAADTLVRQEIDVKIAQLLAPTLLFPGPAPESLEPDNAENLSDMLELEEEGSAEFEQVNASQSSVDHADNALFSAKNRPSAKSTKNRKKTNKWSKHK